MSGVQNVIVTQDEDGQRIDRWLSKRGVPFFLAHKFCRSGQLRIDGKRAKADTRLSAGQNVRIPPYTPKDDMPREEKALSQQDREYIRSLVIYDDGQIIALNKPSGLATQGGTGLKQHVDRLIEGLINRDGVKPRLVHRLDKDISGLLLLARSAEMARLLGKSFKSQDVEKTYLGLCMDIPEIVEGEIKAPILKTSMGKDKDRMVVNHEGKYALTAYKMLDRVGKKVALMAYRPQTGRTHQIRVHSTYIGCPLIGDFKYGYDPEDFKTMGLKKRLHLHAYKIKLPYPNAPRKTLELTAPLADDFKYNMKALGFDTHIAADDLDF